MSRISTEEIKKIIWHYLVKLKWKFEIDVEIQETHSAKVLVKQRVDTGSHYVIMIFGFDPINEKWTVTFPNKVYFSGSELHIIGDMCNDLRTGINNG